MTSKPVPIALITDVGRDIDDTLALLTILGAQKQKRVHLVGVATSGGLSQTRACAVRGYLRQNGIADEDVPIAFGPYETKQPPHCFVPGDCPAPCNAALSKEDGASLLVRLAAEYGEALIILCIGPLDPLAGAATLNRQALQRVGAIYIQGQAMVAHGEGGAPALHPDFSSFNLRESPEAAAAVLSLQSAVPLRFLGKFSAYRVTLKRIDLQEMEALTSLPLLEMLEHTMNTFRTSNPDLFYQLYPVPVEHRTDESWFEHMPHLSHPYDPLCVLLLLQPELFRRTVVKCGDLEHWIVGGTSDTHGIDSADAVINVLKLFVRDGGSCRPDC